LPLAQIVILEKQIFFISTRLLAIVNCNSCLLAWVLFCILSGVKNLVLPTLFQIEDSRGDSMKLEDIPVIKGPSKTLMGKIEK